MNISKFDSYTMQNGRNKKKENRINIDRDEYDDLYSSLEKK